MTNKSCGCTTQSTNQNKKTVLSNESKKLTRKEGAVFAWPFEVFDLEDVDLRIRTD